MTNNLKVDIVIPCYNEEKYIQTTLEAICTIFQNFPYQYEIVVVDNGSSDNSLNIIKKFNVKTIVKKEATIADLRNYGVNLLNGKYLIFLDADVSITEEWYSELLKFINENQNNLIITGAPYSIKEKAPTLQKYWYAGKRYSKKYINSGNLITTRYLFEKLNGFDRKLVTGEDYDFCVRASRVGATIDINSRFRAIHYGYPEDLVGFFKKEVWHGLGDFKDLKSMIRSKPALLSAFNGLFLILCFFILLTQKKVFPIFLYFLFITIVTYTMSIKRSLLKEHILYNMVVSFIYLMARFGSLCKTLKSKLLNI